MSDIRDISLAPSGEKKIRWAAANMPILNSIAKDFEKTQPFKGLTVALSVHFEAKTAYLCRVMQLGGAEMHVTGSNPLSTQDDVAAAIAAGVIDVHADYAGIRTKAVPTQDGEQFVYACLRQLQRSFLEQEYERHLCACLEHEPDIIIDDGGDLVNLMHTKFTHLIPKVLGGCEETTTGIHRLKAMSGAGELRFPMIMVNEADCKHLFDNRYGTGQSVWDGINRTTNLIVAGKVVVVAGYGWCGKGTAMRAKGLGARVVVTEVDPVRAIEAHMDGFEVMPMSEAAKHGDIFVTVTGCNDVITAEHFKSMKNGAILTNAGHFNVEINLEQLSELAVERYEARQNIEGFKMSDGRTLFVIGEGRLVNLAAGDGHPAEIMDMSFAIQALCAKYIAENRGRLPVEVIPVPKEIDNEVAMIKLDSMGIEIDRLSPAQRKYLGI